MVSGTITQGQANDMMKIINAVPFITSKDVTTKSGGLSISGTVASANQALTKAVNTKQPSKTPSIIANTGDIARTSDLGSPSLPDSIKTGTGINTGSKDVTYKIDLSPFTDALEQIGASIGKTGGEIVGGVTSPLQNTIDTSLWVVGGIVLGYLLIKT